MQGLQKQVGARIRELRVKKGLSQEALAEVCRLHRTYVGLIERGQRNLSLSTIEVIAGALGVPVAELFTGLGATIPMSRQAARKRTVPPADLVGHLAAIRQILIDAKLTDARRFEVLVKAYRQNEKT